MENGPLVTEQDHEMKVEIMEEALETKKPQLERTIGVFGGSGIIFGCIVGSGIFITPSYILIDSGSVGLFLIVWIVCGLISIFGGLCFAELGTAIPLSGAEYNYLLEGFGPFLAFLFIWTSVFIIKPAAVTIIALATAKYIVTPFFYGCIVPEIIIKLISIIIILLLTLLNCLSVRWAIRINNVLNWLKFGGILLILGCGIANLFKGGLANFSHPFENTKLDIGSIGAAFFNGLWAFDGWNNLNYAAEEMKNPNKTLPRSIISGMILVTVCYIAINLAFIAALGRDSILISEAVALTVGEKFLGPAAFIVSILVACSTLGSANSTIFGNGRLLFVAAREGHLPYILASIHNTFHTPVFSLVFTSFISILMCIPPSASINQLINLFSYALWVFFLLCFVVVIKLRFWRKDIVKPYKVWIPIPFLMVLVSTFLIVMPIFKDWIGAIIATSVVLSGVPFYLLFIKFSWIIPGAIFEVITTISNFIMAVFDLSVAEKEEDLG